MNAVIIVAGGKGTRMHSDVPKQFLLLNGKPILMHTIERFREADASMQIVLVLPKDQHDYWQELCNTYNFAAPCTIVSGGATRFHSVSNGLQAVADEAELVGVHDGVRPFVSIDVIRECYNEAARSGAVVPVIDVVETLRHILPDGSSQTVSRSEYRLVQTPQVFRASLLRHAYEQEYTDAFTDDASVVEALGHPVTLVAGNRENIKITTPADLKTHPALPPSLRSPIA